MIEYNSIKIDLHSINDRNYKIGETIVQYE